MPNESLGGKRRPNSGAPAQSPFTKYGAHPMLPLKFIRYPYIIFYKGYDSVIMHCCWALGYDLIIKRLPYFAHGRENSKVQPVSPTKYPAF